MKSKIEKLVQANKEQQDPVLSLDDRSLSSLTDISRDFSQFTHITELVLAHNKLTKITQGLLFIENFDSKYNYNCKRFNDFFTEIII